MKYWWLIVLDYTSLFSSLITRCAKDIDALIESLPNDDTSTDLQVCMVEVFKLFIHVSYTTCMISYIID